MECHCASDPFLCMMPVLSVVTVHYFILVILERVDEYLNFQAGIFPCQVMLVVGMLRDRTECRVAGRLWQSLPWWYKLSVTPCPSHAGVGGLCSAESLEGEMLLQIQNTGIAFWVISHCEQRGRHPLTLLPAALLCCGKLQSEEMLVQDRKWACLLWPYPTGSGVLSQYGCQNLTTNVFQGLFPTSCRHPTHTVEDELVGLEQVRV